MSDITNEYGKSKLKWKIEMLEIKLAQERTAHEETKKRLGELARMNQEILDDQLKTEKRLEELESWVLTVVGGMLPHGVWFGTPLQKAIQNAEARKGEAMG